MYDVASNLGVYSNVALEPLKTVSRGLEIFLMCTGHLFFCNLKCTSKSLYLDGKPKGYTLPEFGSAHSFFFRQIPKTVL